MAPPNPTRGGLRSGLRKPGGATRRRSSKKGSTSANLRNDLQENNSHARNAPMEQGTLPPINQDARRVQTLPGQPLSLFGSLVTENVAGHPIQPRLSVPTSNIQNIRRRELPEASSQFQSPRDAQEQTLQPRELHTRNVFARGESSNQAHLPPRMQQNSEQQNATRGRFRGVQSSSAHSPLHMGTQARQSRFAQSQANVPTHPVPDQRRHGQQFNVQTRALAGQSAPSASPDIGSLQSSLGDRSHPQTAQHARPLIVQRWPPTDVETQIQPGLLARAPIVQTMPPRSPTNETSLRTRDIGGGAIEPASPGRHVLAHNPEPTAAQTPSNPFQSISYREGDGICRSQEQGVLSLEDGPHDTSTFQGAAATHRQNTSSRAPTLHVPFSPHNRETTHSQGIHATHSPPGPGQETGGITNSSMPLGHGQSRARSVYRAQNQVVLNREVLQNQASAVQSARAPRERRERPPVPRNSNLFENPSLRAMQSLEESMSNKLSELFDRIKSLENATISMGENICGALDGVRADNDSQTKLVVECQKDVGEKICQCLGTISGTTASVNEQNDSDALAKKLNDAQDFVKYTTCVQYLDPAQGQDFYCVFIAQSKAVESPIVKRAAQFVLGDNADFMEYLKMKRPKKRNGKIIMVDNATLIGRGQGNAQESIRKAVVASFTSACPRSSVLHTSTTVAAENVKRLLFSMFNTAEHKYDNSLVDAWKAAQHGSMAAAYKTAKGAHTSLTMRYPGRQITQLPTKPTTADTFDLSPYKVGFVSFKISKYVETLAIGRKGVHISHGPAWAQEVLFCNEKLNRSMHAEPTNDYRTPIFLSPNVHSPLSTSEVERLRLLAS